jgi:LDH2 family malate/lactate/ureidoglycolate dehydrogenase
MVNTPHADETMVDPQALVDGVTAIYAATGMSDEDARVMASIQVEADLRGVDTHGVAMVPMYVGRLQDPEGINPRGKPHVVHSEAAIQVVDADNAMGHLASRFAMQQAIDRAKETNVAAVAVRHSNHAGAMAYYPMMALEHDMIGIATTGALPSMAPWGGIDQIIGNNPLAAAIPALQELPIVMDMSWQNTFPPKVELWRQRGWPIPDDWSFDVNGKPTTDYDAALAGWGQPSGKFKGVAMALLTGTLAALLSGASWGHELGEQLPVPRPHAGHDGHFFMALRIGAFEDPVRFKERVDNIIGEFRASRTAEGVDRVRMPGERAAETDASRRQDGTPLATKALTNLEDVAGRLGVSMDGVRRQEASATSGQEASATSG